MTFLKNLKAVFPTIEKLVGETFFTEISRFYINQYPSKSVSLYHFGCYFSDFLSKFPHAQQLVYLPEVAQLEWALHEVFYEKDEPLQDWNQLAAVPKEEYGLLNFSLSKASRLFNFQYPIKRIFELCQDPEDTVDLGEGGEWIFVTRQKGDITIEKLDIGHFTLLSAFEQGKTFEEACILALEADSEFNLDSCFQRHVLRGTILWR